MQRKGHCALGHLLPVPRSTPNSLQAWNLEMSSFSDGQLSATTSRFYLYLTYLRVYLFMEKPDVESVIVTHLGTQERK